MKINNFGFIEIDIDNSMLKEAQERDDFFINLYGPGNTHREDTKTCRKNGYLGEIAVKKAYPKLEYNLTHNHDFNFNNLTFDVKSLSCNSQPKPDYVGIVYEDLKEKIVDYYIFTRITNDLKKIWINGFISHKDFFEKSKYMPVGSNIVTGSSFKYEQSRYVLEYNKMLGVKQLHHLINPKPQQ